PRAQRWTLLGAAALGLWYALGEHGGLASLLAHLPGLRAFRFPVKALFVPHLVTAILAGPRAPPPPPGRGMGRVPPAPPPPGAVAGAVAAAALHPGFVAWLAAIEPAFAPRVRQILATSGLLVAVVAMIGAWLASAVIRGRVSPARGAALLAALVVVDLVRVGAGMNAQVSPAFFERLPAMAAFNLGRLDGGRVFSY